MTMKKKYRQFLFVLAIALLFVFSLNFYPASASMFSIENEKYAMQVNNLSCEITDYELHLDLWHLSVAGGYTVMLNNSGDTISIRWTDDSSEGGEIIIPSKTVKKYNINFRFNLVSKDFSYEYKEM